MSWARSKSRIVRSAFAGVLISGFVGASAALAEPAIIVKSTVSDYPVGSKIDDEATVTLEKGDTVSVLTNRGSRTIKGPGTFVVGANPKSNRNRFANLKRKGAASRSGAGVVRSATDSSTAGSNKPNVFNADVALSGRLCLVNTRDVSLWRASDNRPATYIVNGPDLEGPVSVSFDEGVSLAPPDDAPLALSGGATYTIVGGSTGEGPAMTIATVTVIDLGQDYDRADLLAQALFENGCMAQFEVLGERLLSD